LLDFGRPKSYHIPLQSHNSSSSIQIEKREIMCYAYSRVEYVEADVRRRF
jgi:hypothetical protein